MSAPQGNKYAEKWTKELALEFISHVRRAIEKGSIYHIGISSILALEKIKEKYPRIKARKEQIWSYIKEIFSDEAEVSEAIKKAETLAEGKIVEDTLMGEIKSAPMAIFYLKNKHGYKDKSEQEINLNGSIPIEKWLETARDDPS